MVWISKGREFKSFGEKVKETRAHECNGTGEETGGGGGGTKERSEKSVVIVSFCRASEGSLTLLSRHGTTEWCGYQK